MPYKKYKNPDSRCKYPFTNDPLGYCWGFANKVDEKASKEEIKKMCSKRVEKISNVSKSLGLKIGDYWCEFYKKKTLKHILKILLNLWHRFWYENPYCRW